MEPLPAENLCSFCSEITIERLFDHDHQPSIEALRQSSKTCPLCQLIYEAIEPSIDTVQVINSERKTPRGANLPINLQGQSTQEVTNAAHTGKQWRWQNIQISMVVGTYKLHLGEISPYVKDGMLAFVALKLSKNQPPNFTLSASVPFSIHISRF
jgi:hypothetical protein